MLPVARPSHFSTTRKMGPCSGTFLPSKLSQVFRRSCLKSSVEVVSSWWKTWQSWWKTWQSYFIWHFWWKQTSPWVFEFTNSRLKLKLLAGRYLLSLKSSQKYFAVEVWVRWWSQNRRELIKNYQNCIVQLMIAFS